MRFPSVSKEVVITAIGIALGVLGIMIAILGISPDEWPTKIDLWTGLLKDGLGELFANKWKVTSALILAFAVGFIAKRSPAPNILSAAEFERRFHTIFEQQDIRTLLIFGYTHETVRDYQKFEHLYVDGLEIRVLNRSWIAEKIDEEVHNKKIENLKLRPWRKAETISQAARTPWTYTSRREVRYYDFSHPIIKGAILKSKKSTWAFVNFYEWQEIPAQGGSQFKGADLGMIFLDGSKLQERLKIHALESQFNLIWKFRSYNAETINEEYSTYFPA